MKSPTQLAALSVLLASSAVAQISYSTAGSEYIQNFDGLVTGTWSNTQAADGTQNRLGWYVEHANSTNLTLTATAGVPGTLGRIYAFGSGGGDPDRALGAIPSATSGTSYYGLRIVNTTGQTLTSFDLAFVGEQWRIGSNNTSAASLTVDYTLRAPASSTSLIDGSWTNLSALTFTGPKVNTESGGSAGLNGNLAENQANLSTTVTLAWLAGQELWIRWVDIDDTGTDHGLGIDNVSFSASAVPEPSAFAALAGAVVLGLVALRRRRA